MNATIILNVHCQACSLYSHPSCPCRLHPTCVRAFLTHPIRSALRRQHTPFLPSLCATHPDNVSLSVKMPIGACSPFVVRTKKNMKTFLGHCRHTAAILEEAAAFISGSPSPADNNPAAAPSPQPPPLQEIALVFCGDFNSDLNEGVPGERWLCTGQGVQIAGREDLCLGVCVRDLCLGVCVRDPPFIRCHRAAPEWTSVRGPLGLGLGGCLPVGDGECMARLSQGRNDRVGRNQLGRHMHGPARGTRRAGPRDRKDPNKTHPVDQGGGRGQRRSASSGAKAPRREACIGHGEP